MADHEIRIPVQFASNDPQKLRDALQVGDMPADGAVLNLQDGIQLEVQSASESQGFAVSEVIITGIVTIATGVSKDLLLEWLKKRIWPHREEIKTTVDGKPVEDFSAEAFEDSFK